ncbi:MAG: T9SS type A sorting domain-containing protein [Calditrichales bacterium]|nr:T9SS type A sorting domain-containing protein [Calditrichales bacterium]
MKKFSTLWALLIIFAASSILIAQNVNVTICLNTATVPDTVGSNSAVHVRGNTAPLTWDETTGGAMTNVGGDYWEVTIEFPVNTDINYKFFANAAGDGEGSGWESGGDIVFNTGSSDTTLPVQYFRKASSAVQYAPPYTPTDSIDVWFRINIHALVQNFIFDPETQILMLKGGTWPGQWGDLTWNDAIKSKVLQPETGSDNAGQFGYPAEYFWSANVRIPKDSVSEAQSIGYKFVIADKADSSNYTWQNDDWSFTIPKGKADTTLHWRFWNGEPPVEAVGEDTVQVKFRADLINAMNENGYSIGDTLVVRWGYSGSAIQTEDTLINEPLTTIYSKEIEAQKVTLGSDLLYQYYLLKNNDPYREVFYDFNDTSGTGAAERRKLTLPPTQPAEAIVVDDFEDSRVTMRRMPRFQNTNPVSQDVLVTFTCDLRPAYYQLLLTDAIIEDGQGDVDVSDPDSVVAWGVAINGPSTGGWGNDLGDDWGRHIMTLEDKRMWDDGTHGDITPGDTIYAYQTVCSTDSASVGSKGIVGQEFKFGLGGGDNEPGKGGFGLNHVENIDDSQAQFTLHSDFGSINPGFYTKWDFDNHCVTGIDDFRDVTVIRSPTLKRNYPNPFNPVTTIRFELHKKVDVKLVIYNVMGQKVRTLLNGKQNEGVHKVLWSGSDDRGNPVSSGVYFYRLTTENYDKTMKMILLK